jgi:hypothetical protein
VEISNKPTYIGNSPSGQRKVPADSKSEYRWQLMGVGEDRKRGGSLSGRWERNCLYSFPDPAFKLLLAVETPRDCGFWAVGVSRNATVLSRTDQFDESSSNSLIQ